MEFRANRAAQSVGLAGAAPAGLSGSMGRPARAALWVALAALVALAMPAPEARAQDTMGEPPLPSDLSSLLHADEERWFAGLWELRAEPREAREKLVAALKAEVVSQRRWRIYHHMTEFGEAADIPLLLEKLAASRQPREKMVLLGAIRALYRPAAGDIDLSLAVREFAFVQTGKPRDVNGEGEGKWWLSRAEFQQIHRAGFPVELVSKLAVLKGRGYDSREKLAAALEKRLTKELWQAHGAGLMSLIGPRPVEVAQGGMLRFRMRNPVTFPLLLRVDFDAWWGRFDPPPGPTYVYLEPEKPVVVDIPVRLIHPKGGVPLRIDMRMREINGKLAPIFQKLYLSQ